MKFNLNCIFFRSNENSSFRTQIQSLKRDQQDENQLSQSEKARLEQHIDELNLKHSKQAQEISDMNTNLEECRNRIVEL